VPAQLAGRRIEVEKVADSELGIFFQQFLAAVLLGHAESLIEAALRFAIANDAISTVLVGYSTLDQLEYAARAIDKGPLTGEALAQLASLQSSFIGELR